MTRSVAALFFTIFGAIACQQRSAPVGAHGHSELADYRRRIVQLEAELLAAQKKLIQAEEKTEDTRRRVADVEARLSAYAAMTTPPDTHAEVRRGGFTDGRTVRTAPTIPITRAHSPAPEPIVREIGGPASAASSDQVINEHCSKKWRTDFQMVAFCREQQQKAKATLARGNTHGISVSTFDTIRRGCQAKWPTDYTMQAFCEEQQVEAFRSLSR